MKDFSCVFEIRLIVHFKKKSKKINDYHTSKRFGFEIFFKDKITQNKSVVIKTVIIKPLKIKFSW